MKITYENSLEIAATKCPVPFTWFDFAQHAWPDHPYFLGSYCMEEQERNWRKLQVRTATWLARLVKRDFLERIGRRPVKYAIMPWYSHRPDCPLAKHRVKDYDPENPPPLSDWERRYRTRQKYQK